MKRHFFFLLIFMFVVRGVHAQNNKFGISLLQPTSEDIRDASQLVNSNGGDWGYVTLVIQENDRDVRKWQDLFNELREEHLIPIIRLATSPQGEVWRRPEGKDAKDWVEFLDKLNWVVKKRYIILFNEPNHASEWGGSVDPENYGTVALSFAKALHASDSDYVIMLAGLDAAAPQLPDQYEDSGEFIKSICKNEGFCTQLFGYVDAWSSHSYPNPGFSGSVWDSGKKSIRGYEYELQLLNDLGVEKNLPVFITETGWIHKSLSEEAIGHNMETAFSSVWGDDPRVQAVTPFVFYYVTEPFVGFSWKKDGGFTQQYELVRKLSKRLGTPEQIERGVLQVNFPQKLVVNSTYKFSLYLKNTGQGIWDEQNGYELSVETKGDAPFSTLLPALKKIHPNEETNLFLSVKTIAEPQDYTVSFVLKKNGSSILQTTERTVTVLPLPALQIRTSLFPKFISNGDNFEVQFFNKEEELVYAKKGVRIRAGEATVEDIQNVVPGERYRIVLVGYPYLPRQTIITLKETKNVATFKKMLPFDADGDGKWDVNDFKVVLTHLEFLLRFIPWYQG